MKRVWITCLSLVLLLTGIPLGAVNVSAASNADLIFAFLKDEMGLNSAAACGVLANMEAESGFDPNRYGDGGKSYGICQWYNTRFTALRDWCSANGYDYTTLTGQLNYLKFELSANDSNYLWNGKTIYDLLTSVEDTMKGAYDAGYAWCFYYEVPANKAVRAIRRGNLAIYAYWPVYGDGSDVMATQLTANGVNYPINLKTGQPFEVFGTISSPNYLEWVHCFVTDADGTEMFSGSYGFTVAEKEQKIKTYNINLLDAGMLFSDLAGGTYTYYVKALDDKGYFVSVEKTFTVTESDTTIETVFQECVHEHTAIADYTWGLWVTEKSATCTVAGKKSRTCYCGATETVKIKATGHTFDNTVASDEYLKSAATCTSAAVYYKSCSCGQRGTITFKSGSKRGHTYTNACDTSCNICGATRTIKHDYKAATCTRAKTCKKCGVTSGSKLGHSYDKVVTKASATANGSIKYMCTRCKYTASNVTTVYKASKISLSKTTFAYNGKVQKPSVVVKDSKGNKIASSNYTVTYATGCKNVGTYKVTVKFKGNYTGTKSLTFKINPAKTAVSSLTAGSKKLTVKWTKKTTQVTGYQVQYSTTKSFKSYKTKTFTSYSKTSLTLTGLKAKTTYYVRVRTYKTVGGVKYYSGWSTVKSQKTK